MELTDEEYRRKHDVGINHELARMKHEEEMLTPEYKLSKKRLENQQEAHRNNMEDI